MNENVAIIGVGWSGFRPVSPEVSYKELMYEAAMRAYADAGVDPRRRYRELRHCGGRFSRGNQHLR